MTRATDERVKYPGLAVKESSVVALADHLKPNQVVFLIEPIRKEQVHLFVKNAEFSIVHPVTGFRLAKMVTAMNKSQR